MKVRSGKAKERRPSHSARAFGRNLRRACGVRRISVPMLAARTGVSLKIAEKLLAGEKRLDVKLMASVADALGVPLTELLRGV